VQDGDEEDRRVPGSISWYSHAILRCGLPSYGSANHLPEHRQARERRSIADDHKPLVRYLRVVENGREETFLGFVSAASHCEQWTRRWGGPCVLCVDT
jgi:hypothetical protein